MTIEDFVADLSSEYYNLIRQKIRLRNLRSTLELSRERLRIVEERYYIGSMSRLDLQQAQVDFNADSSNVLNQLEQVHTSRIRLNRLMALEDVEEQVLIKDSLITPNPFLDEVELWKSTLTSNSSLLIAKKNQVISELDYKKIKSRNYPYVKLNAGYGYTANWYEVGTTDLQRRLGLNYGGGGRSSGRETIGRVAAGAIAVKILDRLGIRILTYTRAIGPVSIDYSRFDRSVIKENPLFMPDRTAAGAAAAFLDECIKDQDSSGGVVECIVKNMKPGFGDPVFEKLDANLAKAILSIGAVKGFEIGDGCAAARARGSENNDEYTLDRKSVV